MINSITSTSKIAKKKGISFLFLMFFINSICVSAQITGYLQTSLTTCCQNENVTFTAHFTGANDLIYQFMVGGVVVQNFSPNPVYSRNMTVAGTQTVRVDVSSVSDPTLTASDSKNVIVNALPIANAGPDKVLCDGSSTPIGSAPQSGVSYSWSPAELVQDPTVSNPVTEILSTGIYILTVTATTNNFSCTASSNVRIEVVSRPIANAGEDALICENTATRLGSNPQSGVTYSWTPANRVTNATVSNPMTTNLPAGTYDFVLTAASSRLLTCSTTDGVTVVSRRKPTAFTGGNQTICDGFTASLGGIGENGVDYLWSPQSLFNDNTLPDPVTLPLAGQNYTFSVMASWNDFPECYATANVTINTKRNPPVTAGNDRSICEGAETQLGGARVNGISYSWFPNIVNDPAISNPTTIGLFATTQFYLTAETIGAAPVCVTRDTVVVEVIKDATVFPISGGGAYCFGESMADNYVELSSSEIRSIYALFRDGVQFSAWRQGTGSAIRWDRMPSGVYTVFARNEIACQNRMLGEVTITEYTLPSASIATFPSDFICSGDNVQLRISLEGVPPFTFIVESSTGERETVTTNLWRYDINQIIHRDMPDNVTWRILQVNDSRCGNNFGGNNPQTSIRVEILPTAKINSSNNKAYACMGERVNLFVDYPLPTERYSWSTGQSGTQITIYPNRTMTYTLITTNDKGCRSTDSYTLPVRDLPIVSITGFNDDLVYCASDPRIPITGIPDGGFFSGDGMIGNFFYPSMVVGPGIIKYEFTDSYGCVGDTTIRVHVNVLPTVDFTITGVEFDFENPYQDNYIYCRPEGNELRMKGVPSSVIGEWTLHSLGNTTAYIDSSRPGLEPGQAYLVNADPGNYTITYSYSDNKGCVNKKEKMLTIVNAEPDNIDMGDIHGWRGDTLCATSKYEEIRADLTGGEFTVVPKSLIVSQDPSTGLLIIDPSKAPTQSTYGVGYTIIDFLGCVHKVSKSFYIMNPTNVRVIDLDSAYCMNDQDVQFHYEAHFPAEGAITITKNGSLEVAIYPGISARDRVLFKPSWGDGVYEVAYKYFDGNCDNVHLTTVTVRQNPTVNITIPPYFCYGDKIPLTATPAGGEFYYEKNGGGKILVTREIDTKTIGSGNITIYYEFQDRFGCAGSASQNVDVLGVESVDILNIKPEYCENSGEITIFGFQSDAGTPSFSTTSTTGFLTDNGDGTAVMNLSKLNVRGSYNVTYRYDQEFPKVDGTVYCSMDVIKRFSILGKNADFVGLQDTICGISDLIVLRGNQGNLGRFTISDPSLNALKDNRNGTATLYLNRLVEKDYSVTFTYDHYNDNGDLVCSTEKTRKFFYFTAIDLPLKRECTGEETTIYIENSEANAKYILYTDVIAYDTVQGTGGRISFKPISTNVHCKVFVNKNGCLMKLTDEMSIRPLNVNVTKTNVSCFGRSDGTATAVVSGGKYPYGFVWQNSTGAIVRDSLIKSLAPDTYYFEITDVTGCSYSDTIVIIEPDTMVVALNDVFYPICAGDRNGRANAIVSGGTPGFNYNWVKLPAQTTVATTASLVNVESGTYEVRVTDRNGCFSSSRVTFNQNGPLTITVNQVVNNTYFGEEIGEIHITVTGGEVPYSYLWRGLGVRPGNQNDQNLTNLQAGSYFLVVTDEKGCSIDTMIVVTQPEQLLVEDIITPVRCSGGSTGSISLLISGGQPSYSVVWTGSNGFYSTSRNISGLVAGIYHLTVTDANGKRFQNSYEVKEPKKLDILDLSRTNTTLRCYMDSTAILEIDVIGGVTPHKIQWVSSSIPFGQTNLTVYENLPAGNYLVRVTDFNGCIVEKRYEIKQPAKIDVRSTVKNISCADKNDGAITLNPVTGGTPPYDYFWTGGNSVFNRKDQTGLIPATYYVTVQDANNCTQKESFLIKPAILSTVKMYAPEIACSGSQYTELRFDFSGVPTWNVSFSDGTVSHYLSTNLSPTYVKVNPTKNTTYQIIGATDGNRCNAQYSYVADITMIPSPILDVVNIPQNICLGDSIEVELALQQGPVWSIEYRDNGGIRVVNGITDPAFTLKIGTNRSGVLNYEIISVSNAHCKTMINVPFAVSARQYPSMTATPPNKVCAGQRFDTKLQLVGDAPWTVDYYLGDMLRTDSFIDAVSYIEDILLKNTAYHFLSVTSKYGCKTEIDRKIGVEVNPLPDDAFTVIGTSAVCLGEGDYLTPVIPGANSYVWTLPEGVELVSGNETNKIKVRFTENSKSGMIMVQGKNDCGLGVAASIFVTAPKIIGKAGVIKTQLEICRNNPDPIVISTTPIENADRYTWMLPPGFHIAFGQNSSSIMVTTDRYAQSGVIKVWGINGCANSDTISLAVTILAPPVVVAGADKTIGCQEGDRLQLEALNPAPAQGVWSLVYGSGTITNIYDPHTEIRHLAFGKNVLRWEVNDGKCGSVDSVVIMNMNVDLSEPTFSHTVTCMDSMMLRARKPANGTGEWSLVGGGGTIVPINETSAMAYDLEMGTNFIRWRVSNEFCTRDTVITIISNSPRKFAYAGEDETVYMSAAVMNAHSLNNSKVTGKWSIIGGGGVWDNDANPRSIIRNLAEGLNTFRWTVSYLGCTEFDEVAIFFDTELINKERENFIVFPNAFTPNIIASNGGKYTLEIQTPNYRETDVFYPVWNGVDKKGYSLLIFNRWGQLIFRTSDINLGWDGYIDGKLAPQGTYIYKASGIFVNGRTFTQTGEIHLLQ